jgi:uncharacterized membrane protein (UPF0127 family)
MQKMIVKTNSESIIHLEICKSFWSKFMGLMFRKELPSNTGLIFQYDSESILNTSIHMLFMNFPITVVWINLDNIVVDKKIAMPWHIMYASALPACSVIETNTKFIDEFLLGEKLTFTYEN